MQKKHTETYVYECDRCKKTFVTRVPYSFFNNGREHMAAEFCVGMPNFFSKDDVRERTFLFMSVKDGQHVHDRGFSNINNTRGTLCNVCKQEALKELAKELVNLPVEHEEV